MSSNHHFVSVPNILIQNLADFGMSAEEFLIYHFLKSFLDKGKRHCFPSYALIGESLGWSVNTKGRCVTVSRHLKSLQAKGFIKIENRKKNDGTYLSNEYHLVLEDHLDALKSTNPKLLQNRIRRLREELKPKPIPNRTQKESMEVTPAFAQWSPGDDDIPQ